jgi:hypothetical protein
MALQMRMKNMSLRRVIIACVALAAMSMGPPVQAQTPPPPTPSPAFERAYLGEMDAATRAEVEKRATGGNSISGVIATMLLNDNQMASHGKAGGPISVVAVDSCAAWSSSRTEPTNMSPCVSIRRHCAS